MVTTVLVDGGRFGGLIAWDSVGGPSMVTGDDGAFAWTYGSFYGDVTSVNDWALLVAYGDIFLSSVVAETDAVVIAVSDFHVASDITAGDSVLVISLGDFEGEVSAGEDAVFLGEGDFNVTLEAGNDVLVYAYGDVTGSYDAGRDASVITFGNFDAGLHAGRDVGGSAYGIGAPGVWAKGNITGVIDAERNIGDGFGNGLGDNVYALFENGVAYPPVFAGGAINADLYARNSASDPIGGRIGRVGAHGNIDGLFKAESAIDEVFSAGNIDAILDAPLVYPPRENDPTVITQYPLPDTPASIRDDVLAEAAIAYAQLLDGRDEFEEEFEEFLDAMREVEAQVHDSVTNARAATLVENEQTEARLAEQLESARKTTIANLSAEAARLAVTFNNFRASAKRIAAELDNRLRAIRLSRELTYQNALASTVDAGRELAKSDQLMQQAKADAELKAEQAAQQHRAHFVIKRGREKLRILQEQAAREARTAYWRGFGRGLKTGLKANVNALVDTFIGFVSLGTADPWHVLGGQDELGYRAAYGTSRVSQELLFGLGTGGISTSTRFGKFGKAVFVWDTAGNAVSVGRGSVNAYQNGFTWQNSLMIIGGGFGLTGNWLSKGKVFGNVAEEVPDAAAAAGRGLDDVVDAPARGMALNVVEGSQTAPARFVRTVKPGEKIADLIAEGKSTTWVNEAEHAIVSLAGKGKIQRVVVSGGRDGIQFIERNGKLFFEMDGQLVEVRRVIGHTHPRATGPSQGDLDVLGILGQRRSYIIEIGGEPGGTIIRPK